MIKRIFQFWRSEFQFPSWLPCRLSAPGAQGSKATWKNKGWCAVLPIPLFDGQDHPSVPTWLPESIARRGGQGCPKGTAIAARSVLDGPEHDAGIDLRRANRTFLIAGLIGSASAARVLVLRSCWAVMGDRMKANWRLLRTALLGLFLALPLAVAISAPAYSAIVSNHIDKAEHLTSTCAENVIVPHASIHKYPLAFPCFGFLDKVARQRGIGFSFKADLFSRCQGDVVRCFFRESAKQFPGREGNAVYFNFSDMVHSIGRSLPKYTDVKMLNSTLAGQYMGTPAGLDNGVRPGLPHSDVSTDFNLSVSVKRLNTGSDRCSTCNSESGPFYSSPCFLFSLALVLVSIGLFGYSIHIAPYHALGKIMSAGAILLGILLDFVAGRIMLIDSCMCLF